jgi:hypothetical protein
VARHRRAPHQLVFQRLLLYRTQPRAGPPPFAAVETFSPQHFGGAMRFALFAALAAPGIFFISIFSREVCKNLQPKTTRIMRDARARNANKDGIFSEIFC